MQTGSKAQFFVALQEFEHQSPLPDCWHIPTHDQQAHRLPIEQKDTSSETGQWEI